MAISKGGCIGMVTVALLAGPTVSEAGTDSAAGKKLQQQRSGITLDNGLKQEKGITLDNGLKKKQRVKPINKKKSIKGN